MSALVLSANERLALETLVAAGGALLETAIPDVNKKDLVFGSVTPGHATYRRLEKAGLCFYAEAVVTDGVEFTPEVYITDEGRAALAAS